jgi:KDO2-lipid IV(A) lauroyltransferase
MTKNKEVLNEIEDAYPLTLLQAGMVFHSEFSPASAVYHDISIYRMQGAYDGGIFREAVKNRAEKQLFCIWFLADQRPPRNSKFWTTFLNHEAAFFEGAEKISKKLDMAVIFMDIQKVRRGHYEVTFEKLFDNASITKENEITLAGVKKMEEVIIRRPDFWLWSHKRFKRTKPKNVNLIND